ncbi:hypothetical protein NPIL_235181 [Nephila pilipes]|uniref:Uncharacterized protein n=1 Tax=Nephila pilipes TaxID=299642 RepID=A0A8X6M7R1_NEPPI|nr:hypothetical protein NPIL_235181 [Nephila pilipes]
MRLLLRGEKLGSRGKEASRQREARLRMLQRFLKDAGNTSSWMEDEDAEDDTCECQKFDSTPHQMFGRRKESMNEYVGFYDSLFEKPD